MTTLATPLCDEKVTPAPGAELVAAAAADTVTATPKPPTRAVAETMATKRLRISIPLGDDEQPTKRARIGPPRITRSYPRHTAFCNQRVRPPGAPPAARPRLPAPPLTTAALWSAPFTPLIVHDTVVGALCPTSGCTAILQVPRTLLDCGSVMVNVTTEGPRVPVLPPRFFSEAATTQGDPHAEVSTLTTV